MKLIIIGEIMNLKPKRTQARVTFVVSACFLAVLSILFSCLLAFVLPQAPRYPQAMMTAEYLEEYPLQTPSYMLIDQQCLNAVPHCLTIFLDRFPAMTRSQRYRMTHSLILTIDGDIQTEYFISRVDGSLYAELPSLGEGLHLIEVEIQDKNKQVYRHSWTIRLGNGIAAPPTQALPPTVPPATP
jgi:hypothetical protein